MKRRCYVAWLTALVGLALAAPSFARDFRAPKNHLTHFAPPDDNHFFPGPIFYECEESEEKGVAPALFVIIYWTEPFSTKSLRPLQIRWNAAEHSEAIGVGLYLAPGVLRL